MSPYFGLDQVRFRVSVRGKVQKIVMLRNPIFNNNYGNKKRLGSYRFWSISKLFYHHLLP